MAIGTIGGKLGCLVGPIIGAGALIVSVTWFGISEDGTAWYRSLGWLVFGVGVAIVTGLLLRHAANRLCGDESERF